MNRCSGCVRCLKGNTGANPEQSRYCNREQTALRHWVTEKARQAVNWSQETCLKREPSYLREIGKWLFRHIRRLSRQKETTCFFMGKERKMKVAENIVLVLGGARSGKSQFAENYVLHAGAVCGYIATAEILDAEMRERVQLHQARRKQRWITFEAPYEAEKVFSEAGVRTDAILFDDLTLYLSNLLYGKNAPEGTVAQKADYVREQMEKLLQAAAACGRPVVFVSNEVGSGIVPDNPMAREYRDIAGWVNQQVGEAASRVFYVIAGQAVDIKRLAFTFAKEN